MASRASEQQVRDAEKSRFTQEWAAPERRAARQRLGWRVAAAAVACVASSACAAQTTPAQALPAEAASSQAAPVPELHSVGQALSRFQDEYEFGWRSPEGAITYSKVTSVALEGDGNVRVELAEPSLLWGAADARTFSGRWKDASGEGALWLEFVADYSSAAGWWSGDQAPERHDLWVRRSE